MLIDGKKIGEKIIRQLAEELKDLKDKKAVPGLAIVTLGPEESWEKYVSQKIKLAEKLGIPVKLINLQDPTEEKLIELIEKLNSDESVSGIIVQRPLTKHIKEKKVTYAVSPKKDIDGFIKNATFKPPIWLALLEILSEIAKIENQSLENFILNKNIVVIGKGETAGMPVIEGFKDLGIEPQVIDSKTKNKNEILKNADIVISAVGKSNVFRADDLKRGVIVIGIGLHREDGLKPDFNEEEIKKVAKYYTPTPGGIGPINLAYLFKNLLKATKSSLA